MRSTLIYIDNFPTRRVTFSTKVRVIKYTFAFCKSELLSYLMSLVSYDINSCKLPSVGRLLTDCQLNYISMPFLFNWLNRNGNLRLFQFAIQQELIGDTVRSEEFSYRCVKAVQNFQIVME